MPSPIAEKNEIYSTSKTKKGKREISYKDLDLIREESKDRT